MRKILICTPLYPPDIGGPATYSKLLFDELSKYGIAVKVLSFGEVRSLPKLIRHCFYFFKVLRRGAGVDIVFAQDPVSVGLPSLLAAKILGKKFVLKIVGDYAWEMYANSARSPAAREMRTRTCESDIDNIEKFQTEQYNFITELRRKIERWVGKRADSIIVPSEYLKKIVLMWGVPPQKINVVYNAFKPMEISASKEELRQKLGIEGFVLVSAGRLVPWKGFGALVEIMPEILKEIPEAKLYIIGSGPQEKKLKFKIKDLKLKGSVFLTGQIPHKELLKYLTAGDVFILNTGYEGFSHLLLEAMAAGIPVVATGVGGNLEIIENSKNGILVEYNNKEQIKNAILRLYKSEELRKKFIKNAKEKVKEFNQDKMIAELIKRLEALGSLPRRQTGSAPKSASISEVTKK